jgi:hypothetical protein
MDQERAEQYLRLLAEEELRRMVPGLREAANADRLARVVWVLTALGVLEDGAGQQVLDDFGLALDARGAGPRGLARVYSSRGHFAASGSRAGSGPRATRGRIVPLGQLIQIRDGEVFLLSYARTASGPQLSLLARAGVRDWPGVPPLERFTVTDDRGTRYRMQVLDLGGEGDGWTLMLRPNPTYDPQWLDLTTAPGEPAVRIALDPSARGLAREFAGATVTVSAATLSPGEHLLHAIAARLLVAPWRESLTTVADGLGDVIAALLAAGVLSPLSPVPGQLAALCTSLNVSGHGITAPPAWDWDLPVPWLDVLAHDQRRRAISAGDGFAAAVATFPELDGIRLAILGLHNGHGRTVLHIHASGPMCQVTYGPEELYRWPTLWIRDSGGRWHATQTIGTRGMDAEIALRLEVVPPLSSATTWAEVLVAGQSAQARTTLPLLWE